MCGRLFDVRAATDGGLQAVTGCRSLDAVADEKFLQKFSDSGLWPEAMGHIGVKASKHGQRSKGKVINYTITS